MSTCGTVKSDGAGVSPAHRRGMKQGLQTVGYVVASSNALVCASRRIKFQIETHRNTNGGNSPLWRAVPKWSQAVQRLQTPYRLARAAPQFKASRRKSGDACSHATSSADCSK